MFIYKYYISGLLLFGIAAAQGRDLDAELNTEARTQTGTAITIIFDNSGSMKTKGKIDQAKRAFVWWLESLPEQHRLGLIHFKSSRGHVGESIASDNREDVRKTVQGLAPAGKTPLVDCLQLASKEVDRRRSEIGPYERHVVVLFTDGYETVHRGKNPAVVNAVRELRNVASKSSESDFTAKATTLRRSAQSTFTPIVKRNSKRGSPKWTQRSTRTPRSK